MKHVTVSLKIIIGAKRIKAGILANIFVKKVNVFVKMVIKNYFW